MIGRLHTDWISTHLNILAIEAMLCHFERKTPRPHNPSIQIGFKLDALKGVQVIAPSVWNQAVNKNIVQGFWAPLIAGVWQIQLFWHVLGQPLRQFLRKILQKGMVLAVSILESRFAVLVRPWSWKHLLLQQHDIQRRGFMKALGTTIAITYYNLFAHERNYIYHAYVIIIPNIYYAYDKFRQTELTAARICMSLRFRSAFRTG